MSDDAPAINTVTIVIMYDEEIKDTIGCAEINAKMTAHGANIMSVTAICGDAIVTAANPTNEDGTHNPEGWFGDLSESPTVIVHR
jgi:hypothetical protein